MARVLGPIDLAAIPIGAYDPRWHLHLQHTDPLGAVKMLKTLQIGRAVGVHWGTWLMSDERYDQPPVDLAKAVEAEGVEDGRFTVEPVGRTFVVE